MSGPVECLAAGGRPRLYYYGVMMMNDALETLRSLLGSCSQEEIDRILEILQLLMDLNPVP